MCGREGAGCEICVCEKTRGLQADFGSIWRNVEVEEGPHVLGDVVEAVCVGVSGSHKNQGLVMCWNCTVFGKKM